MAPNGKYACGNLSLNESNAHNQTSGTEHNNT